MTKPLISYYGGKQRIAGRIVDIITTVDHSIYAEPFCGGCATMFKKGRPNAHPEAYREAINDRNELIVNMYRVARDDGDALAAIVEGTCYSRSEHRRAVDICNGTLDADALTRAWAVVVNAEMSFAHKFAGGWGYSRKGENHSYTWHNKRGRVREAIARFERVYIDCDDALAFIRRWDSPTTLFYCDPPYPDTQQGHYAGYSLDDFSALCDTLDSIKGGYILSCYDQGSIYPQTTQQRVELEASCSARNGAATAAVEVLWIKKPPTLKAPTATCEQIQLALA